jgi:hypothetical protein
MGEVEFDETKSQTSRDKRDINRMVAQGLCKQNIVGGLDLSTARRVDQELK